MSTVTVMVALAELRRRLHDEWVEALGMSAAVVYRVHARRLSAFVSTHVDPERSEQFDAVSSLVRGVSTSASDLRAAAARSGRSQRDRFIAWVGAGVSYPDPFVCDEFEDRLAIPIRVGNEITAVLMIVGPQSGIDDLESRFSASIAPSWAHVVPDRSVDIAATGHVTALAEMMSALVAATTRDNLAAEVLDAGLDAVGAPGGSFVMWTPPGVYQLVQSRSIDSRIVDRWAQFSPQRGNDPFSDAIATGRALFYENTSSFLSDYPHLVVDVEPSPHNSWAVIPFTTTGDAPEGALGMTFEEEQTFERARRVAMRSVAHLTATAARRIETQRADQATLASVNANLVSASHINSDVAGITAQGFYQPAGSFSIAGGDWYDVIDNPHRPDTVYTVLGDVADHGPTAAGAMATVRSWVRAYAYDGAQPADIAARVSDFIVLDELAVTTAVIGSIDLTTKTWTWCTAGHPYPIVIDDAGVRLLDTTHGPPLGADNRFRSGVLALDRPMRIVLYSDGLLTPLSLDINIALEQLVAAVRHTIDAGDVTPEAIVEQLGTPRQHAPDDIAVLVIDIDLTADSEDPH